MPSVVLITGVSRYLGTHLAARLAADPGIERVIGVDTVPPRTPAGTIHAPSLGRTEFVRADIRNPLIAKVIRQAGVDTVVHTSPHARLRVPLRSADLPLHDQHVTGTMQVLAGCQVSPTLRRVVLASTTAVYGSSARNPAVFTETTPAADDLRHGYSREAVEVENHVRGFARRRPDVAVNILRMANIVGPTIDTALTRYLAMPVVPTSLGLRPAPATAARVRRGRRARARGPRRARRHRQHRRRGRRDAHPDPAVGRTGAGARPVRRRSRSSARSCATPA